MKPTIYFKDQPCNKAKEILLDYFEDVTDVNYYDAQVVWTGLKQTYPLKGVVVATPCTGTDHVTADAIIHLDDEFKETEGKLVTSTAEHTLSLMLQLAKKARIQLYGKVLGIIGYGRIGSMVAEYCNALGMKILTYDIKGHGNCTLNEIYKNSDIITIHVPYSDWNRYMINTPELCMMKAGTLLINTSRQNVVETRAIEVQLKNKRIYYADDFIEDYCFEYYIGETVVQTQHIAGNSIEARETTDIWLAKKLIRYWRSMNP